MISLEGRGSAAEDLRASSCPRCPQVYLLAPGAIPMIYFDNSCAMPVIYFDTNDSSTDFDDAGDLSTDYPSF